MTTRRNREAGFTFIEIIVVMTVLGFAYALAAPAISNWFDGPRMDSAVRDMIISLREARARAITSSSDVAFSPTIDANSIQLSQSAPITFFIDGSSSGGRITLTSDDQTRAIQIDWLTGRIGEVAK
jgi:general secretion pathway protein H